MHLLEIVRRESRWSRQGEYSACQTTAFGDRSRRTRNDVLLFHLPHLSAQTADVPLFPLSRAQRVVLEQQLLKFVRRIKVRLLRLPGQRHEYHTRRKRSEILTSGMNGAICSLVSRVSQSIVENQGCLFNSSKPSPLGLQANRLEGSLSKN